MLKAALEGYGFKVGTTRTDQAKDLGLTDRGKAAAGYDLFISIHSNAVGSGVNNSVDYPVAITMVNDDKASIDEESKAVGEILAQVVAAAMGTSQAARTYTKLSANDRDGNGIKDDEYYGVLHGAKLVRVPGIILEHSFHTNAKAAAWLLVDSNLQAMAAAEAAALASYYGMRKQESQEPEQPQQPQAAYAEYGDEGRHQGFAGSPDGAGGQLNENVGDIAGSQEADHGHPDLQHIVVGGEDGEDGPGEEHHDGTDGQGDDGAHAH